MGRFRISDLLTATPVTGKKDLKLNNNKARQSDTGEDSCSEVVKVKNVKNILQLSKTSPDVDGTCPRPSSLQQLQSLDMFKAQKSQNVSGQSDSDSFMLETDQYVRQMKKRRVDLMSQFDSSATDRFRRKVGYEIEKRLVKVLSARTIKKKPKSSKSAKSVNSMYHMYKSKSTLRAGSNETRFYTSRRRRHKRYRKHHRFCLKCLTSSFSELFRMVTHPLQHDNHQRSIPSSSRSNSLGQRKRHLNKVTRSDSENTGSRFPTPKMLLNTKDGKIQWPVFQYGGTSGSGMLISTGKMYSAPPRVPQTRSAGRENFSLGAQIDPRSNPGTTKPSKIPTSLTSAANDIDKSIAINHANINPQNAEAINDNPDKDSGLVGWLQVRDVRNKRHYVQVIDPSPQGPFRKLPWNPSGTFHVMKF